MVNVAGSDIVPRSARNWIGGTFTSRYLGESIQSGNLDFRFNECKLLRKMPENESIPSERLFVRLALKLTFDPNSREREYTLWDNTQKKFSDLRSPHDKSEEIAQIFLRGIFSHLYELVEESANKPSIEDMYHWFNVMQSNANGLITLGELP